MKFHTLSRIVTILAVCAAAQSTFAQPSCETTFTPLVGNSGYWDDDDNWTVQEPDSTLVACIPPGKTAIVKNYNGTPYVANAEAIWIKADGSSRGKVTLEYETQLKLYDDSQIDGDLQLNFPEAMLTPQADLTITGDGGAIVGGSWYNLDESIYSPLINGSYTLTLECDPQGGGSLSECVVVRGHVDIAAPLVNNAYVIADNQHTGPGVSKGNLRLSTNGKSGSGYWIASNNASWGTVGHMVVDVSVTGSGTWVLADHAGAKITVNTALTGLTGDVQVHKGTLNLNANFTTTGDLEFKSVGGSTPQINAAEGVVARFKAAD